METNRDSKKGEANDAEDTDLAIPLVIEVGLFSPGRFFMTPGAMDVLHNDDTQNAIRRHLRGDWGDVCADDWEANASALNSGCRLFSVYHDRNRNKFWIITEADRSATTVLLPEEY